MAGGIVGCADVGTRGTVVVQDVQVMLQVIQQPSEEVAVYVGTQWYILVVLVMRTAASRHVTSRKPLFNLHLSTWT